MDFTTTMENKNMTTQTTNAQIDVNALYQLAHNIESGAYVSSSRVIEFLTHLKNTNAFVSSFDHIKAFDGATNE